MGVRLYRRDETCVTPESWLTALALVAASFVSALPAAAQTGRVGGTVKDGRGPAHQGRHRPRREPSGVALVFYGDDRRQGPLFDHRSALGHAGKSRRRPRASQPGGGNVPVRTIGAPNPPVDIILAPGATGPAGALAGVNTKELQGELSKADELMNAAAVRRERSPPTTPFSPRRRR